MNMTVSRNGEREKIVKHAPYLSVKLLDGQHIQKVDFMTREFFKSFILLKIRSVCFKWKKEEDVIKICAGNHYLKKIKKVVKTTDM